MGFYRKKPLEVEAHKFEGSSTSAGQIRKWMETGVWKDSEIHTRDFTTLEINTLEGVMVANPGDYVIKGAAGEFYTCKADIFNATYEPLENTDRLPGEYQASDLRIGDVINFCGKDYQVSRLSGSHGSDIAITLDDGSNISVRPTAVFTVSEVL